MKSSMDRICRFFRRDHGLVAVEWVALTSGLVIGAIVIGVTVMSQTETEADLLATGIESDGCNAAVTGSTNAGTFGVAC